MRKLVLFSALFVFSFSLFAQTDKAVIQKNVTAIKVNEKQIVNQKVTVQGLDQKLAGVVIGNTNYDLQTNSAVANRIINFGDGRVSATWIQDHSGAPGGATRGAGYNHSTNYSDGLPSWQYTDMDGNSRIQDERTGWPTLMSNGTEEYVAAHLSSFSGMFGNKQTIGAAGSNWPEDNIEGGPEAMLWPRGASAGDYYYAIAVDDYVNSPSEIESVHFYKSDDAGANWTYTGVLPNFNDYYFQGQGDVYAIDAKDNYVAIVVFGDYSDTRLWKSDNYGETFTQMVINDSPVDRYNFTGGVILDEDEDGAADTLMTTDQTGDVIIDNNGKVHVVFSRMRNLDEDASDNGAFSYFPGTDWLLYWNEDMGEGEYGGMVTTPGFIDMAVPAAVDTIGWSYDNNGDGEWVYAVDGSGFASFGTYYTAMTSFSKLGIDADNNLYVIFSTVMEGEEYIKSDANPLEQSYRHVFIRGMNGATGVWGNPICISNEVQATENVFPTMARTVGDDVLFWYQSDNEPGLHIRGDEDPTVTDNAIIFKAAPAMAFITDVNELSSNYSVNVYPNPANDYITLTNVQNADVEVYNILGAKLYSSNSSSDNMTINMSKYSAGTYFVKVTSVEGTVTKKVIVK